MQTGAERQITGLQQEGMLIPNVLRKQNYKLNKGNKMPAMFWKCF
jgi:hypothetical protein